MAKAMSGLVAKGPSLVKGNGVESVKNATVLYCPSLVRKTSIGYSLTSRKSLPRNFDVERLQINNQCVLQVLLTPLLQSIIFLLNMPKLNWLRQLLQIFRRYDLEYRNC